MRVGLFLGDLLGLPADDVVAGIKGAAEEGFTSAWLPQVFGYEALTLLAIAGREIPGIELGTAVIPTYPRHPITLAGQALTVQSVTGGRLALGIGLSHQVVIEGMFGYSFDKPARHMRDYLDILLPLLRDGNVSHTGETNSAHIGLTSPRDHPVPVYLAALAPRMLHLAGAVADGTIRWMSGPSTVESYVVPTLTEAAAEAGRSTPRVVCILPVCVTNDPDAARERANKVFAVYNQLPSYRAMLDIEGAGGPGDVAIVGDEGAVRKQIGALADIGVTDFVAGSYGAGDDAVNTRALLSAIARGEA